MTPNPDAADSLAVELDDLLAIAWVPDAIEAPTNPDPRPPGLYVVFDGPPSHESGRFVEVEDETGAGVAVGTWRREAGLWALGPFSAQPAPALDVASLRAAVEALPTYGHLVPRGDEPSPDNAMLHRAAVLALFEPTP